MIYRFGLCFLVAVTAQVCAQQPSTSQLVSEPDTPSRLAGQERPAVETIEAEIAELSAEIEAASQAATDETSQRLTIRLDRLKARVDRLRALEGILRQQISALQRLDEIATSQVDLEQEILQFAERGPEESPPYTLNYVDRLQDELDTEARNVASIETQIETAQAELETARARLGEAERERRAARETAESNTNPSESVRLLWEANRAQLEARYQESSVVARTLRKEAAEAELALTQTRFDLVTRKLDAVMSLATFGRNELEERLSETEAKFDAVQRELPKLRDTYQANEARRAEARDRLQNAKGDEAIAAATAHLAARTAWVETAGRAVELAEKKLSLGEQEKLLWERRHNVWSGEDDILLGEWKEETDRIVEEAKRDRQVQASRLIDLRTAIIDIEKQLVESTTSADRRDALDSRLNALRSREEILNDYLAALLPVERLAARVTADIARERALVTWTERWTRVGEVVGRVWNFEVVAYQDDPITVRKIVTALTILFVGIFMAGFLTRLLHRRILSRTPLTENAAAAVEKLTYYVSLILILLYALNFVNIPLTLFAFLGGAIAIAVGFGAQHIINNFISGFILMFERPIRIGDLVEINGIYGHIRHIGARSTRLHTSDNIDLLIPNSQLLENVVTNWTLTDERLRTYVTVGVAYGSPTETVSELLMQAATDTKRVVSPPKPIVLFTDFGDNALNFEIHFWVKMRRMMDKRLVESDVRTNIVRLFREHNIVIAFPQRDIHFDSDKPIAVQIKDSTRDISASKD